MNVAFGEGLPEPSNLWIRYRPRSWPAAAGAWCDPVGKGLGVAGRGLDLSGGAVLDDVLWLPPVAAASADQVEAALEPLMAAGTPVLQQILPGQVALPGARAIVDWLEPLLSSAAGGAGSWQGESWVTDAVSGANVLWPLIRGVTDTEERMTVGVESLRSAGVREVVGVALDLQPRERRALAERLPESDYAVVFHGGEPNERGFHRAVATAGLSWKLERPLPQAPARLRNGRWLAEKLAWGAELGSRLGWPASRAQAWYQAARELDRAEKDWLALSREGNLAVVPWLDDSAREVLIELGQGESRTLTELEAAYLADLPPAGT